VFLNKNWVLQKALKRKSEYGEDNFAKTHLFIRQVCKFVHPAPARRVQNNFTGVQILNNWRTFEIIVVFKIDINSGLGVVNCEFPRNYCPPN
jgi:hypothetical protein